MGPLPAAALWEMLCEAFHCPPSAALQELERWPAGVLGELLEARSYRRMKELYDAADTREAQQRLPASPLMDLIRTIDFELAKDGSTRHD